MKKYHSYKQKFTSDKTSQPSKNKKRAEKWFFVSIALGIGIFVIIIKQIQLNDLLLIIQSVKLKYVAIFFLLGLNVTLLRAFRFLVYFKSNQSFTMLYGAFALLRPINIIFPLRTGDAAFIFLLKKFNLTFNITETIPIWILLKTTDLFALTILLFIASILAPYIKHVEFYKFGLLLMFVIAFICMIIGWGLVAGKRIGNDKQDWISKRIKELKNGFKRMDKIRDIVQVVSLACIIWIAFLVSLVFIQKALSTPLDFYSSFLAAALVLSASILPIHAPLSIGTGEAVWIGVYSLLGVKLNDAIILSVGIRIFELSIVFIDGLIGSILLYRQRKNQLL